MDKFRRLSKARSYSSFDNRVAFAQTRQNQSYGTPPITNPHSRIVPVRSPFLRGGLPCTGGSPASGRAAQIVQPLDLTYKDVFPMPFHGFHRSGVTNKSPDRLWIELAISNLNRFNALGYSSKVRQRIHWRQARYGLAARQHRQTAHKRACKFLKYECAYVTILF